MGVRTTQHGPVRLTGSPVFESKTAKASTRSANHMHSAHTGLVYSYSSLPPSPPPLAPATPLPGIFPLNLVKRATLELVPGQRSCIVVIAPTFLGGGEVLKLRRVHVDQFLEVYQEGVQPKEWGGWRVVVGSRAYGAWLRYWGRLGGGDVTSLDNALPDSLLGVAWTSQFRPQEDRWFVSSRSVWPCTRGNNKSSQTQHPRPQAVSHLAHGRLRAMP